MECHAKPLFLLFNTNCTIHLQKGTMEWYDRMTAQFKRDEGVSLYITYSIQLNSILFI